MTLDGAAQPPSNATCVACGQDASPDPVQLLEPAKDPAAILGWLCVDCFDLGPVLNF